jgi:hypothetical protein
MNDWLAAARDRLAAATGDDSETYELSAADGEALLELARVAAHESGQRTNAPLVCFLLGRALGRHPELDLARLAREATDPGG